MVNLASPLAFWEYAPHRGQLEKELRAVGPEIHSLFLDEAQRVPELLDVAKVLVDEQPRRFRFFFTVRVHAS